MKKTQLVGRVVTAIPVLFLAFDAVIKLMQIRPVVESFTALGYPAGLALGIGAIELVCLLVYVTPLTSALGAILLTGYLGGGVASHVRMGDPLVSHSLFPVYVGVMVWGGLFLRDERLRALIPVRKTS